MSEKEEHKFEDYDQSQAVDWGYDLRHHQVITFDVDLVKIRTKSVICTRALLFQTRKIIVEDMHYSSLVLI